MAQNLDSELLFTTQMIETWAGTKLDTCPVPNAPTDFYTLINCTYKILETNLFNDGYFLYFISK